MPKERQYNTFLEYKILSFPNTNINLALRAIRARCARITGRRSWVRQQGRTGMHRGRRHEHQIWRN